MVEPPRETEQSWFDDSLNGVGSECPLRYELY